MKIVSVERIPVDAGHTERPGRHMRRKCADWSIIEVCKVMTDTGLVGWGETVPHYTWGRVSDEAAERAIGRNPAELMWDDSLGAGLQQALFDVTGKALGVPAYRLIGHKVRDWCPIAWWCWDMPPDEWVGETQDAVAAGYVSFKLKARPWHDVRAATQAISDATPDHCVFDLDFNSLLVSAGQAQHVLAGLETFPKVHFFETPIPQHDVAGNRSLRSKLRRPVAMHFDNPPFLTAVQEDVCDGWVLNQGAARNVHQAALGERGEYAAVAAAGGHGHHDGIYRAPWRRAAGSAVACHYVPEHVPRRPDLRAAGDSAGSHAGSGSAGPGD